MFSGPQRMRNLGWTVGAAIGAMVLLAALYIWGPTAATVEALADQLRNLGLLGGVIFALIYALAAAVMLPATPFPLTAGFLWGPFGGFAVAWAGEFVGAMISFGLGRTLFRRRAKALATHYPLFAALEDAVDEGGLQLLLLLRMSPVFPFGVLNYGLGATAVRPGAFAFSTLIGVIPASMMLAYAGASLTRLADAIAGDAPLGWTETILSGGGLLATGVVLFTVSRATRRALDKRLNA